jgi:predicted nucleic acid-binding protein
MIYLDSAAVVKLAHAEPESPALRRWLDERADTGWISSVLTEIEAFRALARYAPEAAFRLPPVLDQIDLIDVDPSIRVLARAVKPVTVRSLDAIHLGTALYSRRQLTSFVTYDKRLLDAAQAMNLQVDSPALPQPTAPVGATVLVSGRGLPSRPRVAARPCRHVSGQDRPGEPEPVGEPAAKEGVGDASGKEARQRHPVYRHETVLLRTRLTAFWGMGPGRGCAKIMLPRLCVSLTIEL